MSERLVGQALIQKVSSMPGASKSEKARACGYVTIAADGTERLSFTAFYEALAVASGVELEGQRRPQLSYQASVLTNGAILIGPRYVEQLGLTPGDQVSLQIRRGAIAVTPVA